MAHDAPPYQRLPLPEPMHPEHRGFSLRDLYDVGFRHRSKVLIFFLAVTVTTIVLLVLAPDTYVSKAELLIRQGRESRVDPSAVTGPSVSLFAEWQHQFNSELSILTSQELAQDTARAVGAEDILQVPENSVEQRVPILGSMRNWLDSVGRKLRQGITPMEGEGREAADPQLAAATTLVQESLEVDVPTDSTIIRLSYASTDPALAQRVLAQLTDAYLAKHIKVHKSEGSYDFFKEQSEQVRSELEIVENQIREMNNALGIASLGARRSTIAARIASLESSIEGTETDIATSLARVEALKKMVPGADETSDGGRLRSHGLFTQGAYSDVQKAVMNDEAEAAALTAKAVLLRRQLADANHELENLNNREIDLTKLERQQTLLSAKYAQYAEHLEQARIDQALQKERFSNISIVQGASYPTQPENANRKLKFLMAMVLGLCGGVGLAFISEYLDTSLRRPEDVERHLGLQTFVSIPFMEENKVTLVSGRETSVETRYAADAARYYEILRDRLLLALNGSARQPIMLAVTSANAGEGVSTVAANLAITLARHGDQPVLFVDANLKHPAAQDVFGVQRGPGLAEIIANGEGATTTIEQNLYVLAAGEQRDRLPQTMVPQKFENLKNLTAKKNYGFIIFDVPAISEGTATARLASMVDGVLLVAEAEKVRCEVAQRAKSLLEEAKANVLGVVLNKRKYYVPKWLYQRL